MNWEELERKHQEQWEQFEKLKTKAWDTLEKNRKAMYAAFGDQETRIPMSVFERVEREREEWRNAWGDNGYKAKYLLAIQKKERDTMKEYAKNNILEQMRIAREKSRTRNKERERDG